MIDFSKIEHDTLSKKDDISTFDCGDVDLNEFIKYDALSYQEKKLATTILFLNNQELMGFISISTDSLKLNFDEKEGSSIHKKRLEEVPSVKIARLAVDLKYQQQKAGTFILKWSVGYILECSDMIATRFITVDSYPNKTEFYNKFGFLINENRHYKKKENHIDNSADKITFGRII